MIRNVMRLCCHLKPKVKFNLAAAVHVMTLKCMIDWILFAVLSCNLWKQFTLYNPALLNCSFIFHTRFNGLFHHKITIFNSFLCYCKKSAFCSAVWMLFLCLKWFVQQNLTPDHILTLFPSSCVENWKFPFAFPFGLGWDKQIRHLPLL